jgi:protein TonB
LSVAERFQTALFISATLHAIVLLGLQFRQPPPEAKQASSLNVVLVNSKSETRPDNAQALAQANLDGGGNTDEERLAKSPVPVGNAEFKDGASPPPPAAKPARKNPKTQSKPSAVPPAPPSIRVPEPPPLQTEATAAPSSPVEAKSVPVEVPPSPAEAAIPPELQAVAQQEAQARERVAELEREARELMTQLKSERAIEQPSTTFTVPPDYQPRPSETSDRGWPPSPPPSSPAQSAARVVKVEPRETTAAHANIQAPPKEARTTAAAPQQPSPQVVANAGLKPTAAAEDAPTSATPELKAQTKLTQAQAPAAAAAPHPDPLPAPAPPPVAPQAPQPEVKVVRLENKFSTPEPPELRPQPPPAPTQQVQAPTAPAPAPEIREETPASDPPKPSLPSASELMRRSSEIARLEAQIAKNYDEYQKRPRRKFIGARTAEFRFAQYIEEWRAKVERVGNTNYPEAAKQRRIYGSLQLTVAIRSDGAVESVEINRSSGQKVLDAAAIRIVELAGPYSHFPADISKDTDVLHITRTWTFTRGDQLVSE